MLISTVISLILIRDVIQYGPAGVKHNNNIQPWCYSFMCDVDMKQIFLLFAQ